MADWQPIETHPLNDKECLLAILDQHGRLYAADRGWWEPGDVREEWDEVEEGVKVLLWEEEDEGNFVTNHGMFDEPTHWQPLPDKPTE